MAAARRDGEKVVVRCVGFTTAGRGLPLPLENQKNEVFPPAPILHLSFGAIRDRLFPISYTGLHMPEDEPKKIAYLFGAGATHAELQNLDPDLIEEKSGLLIGNVSSRVIEKARRDEDYMEDVAMVSGTSGSLNIELLISLIESSKIHGWERKTQRLKTLVQEDIADILSEYRSSRFYLHKALFEFHRHAKARAEEDLIGLISLNYDDVLDRAYERYYGRPNYCFSLDDKPSLGPLPLLKLHGSFNWKRQKVRERWRKIEIIPLGAAKSYLHAPYGFIWNRALEVLIRCDKLRVIGCSLSPNDAHLIDLLFKAHLEKGKAFDIEIISSTAAGENIKKNYGFFRGIKTLVHVESSIPEENPANPFKTWLKHKSIRVLGESRLKATQHLRKL